ncbi:F-box/FBD/LRR-repeat protein-like protein [Tanacetum coccineum]|uniref:F-box/FBD/LRR-repeat protein-like protein n=1 Tax=Tanacetum coccineum TaxID=301880 RepID=A0ABQ5GM51_9ASTR
MEFKSTLAVKSGLLIPRIVFQGLESHLVLTTNKTYWPIVSNVERIFYFWDKSYKRRVASPRLLEMVRKTLKASKSAPVDIISTMPDNVMSNILNRLPIDCAVGTSILSKNWRFNWTLITQIVFQETLMLDWRIISRILLHLRDDITKIFIEILPPPFQHILDIEDIYHLVLFVSRKGIQELTLDNKNHKLWYWLPTHIFSCVELKYLELTNCGFPSAPASFTGFPNLLSLKLYNLTKFPSKLEDLTLEFCNCEFSADAIVQNRVSSVLCCLKSLKLRWVQFTSGMVGSSIFQLIFSSPNLQTLNIHAAYDLVNDGPQSALNFDFASMRQLQLQSVNLHCNRDSENEVSLIKYLLAFSPMLKNMDLFLVSPNDRDHAKLQFALKLLELERASPIAQIQLCG